MKESLKQNEEKRKPRLCSLLLSISLLDPFLSHPEWPLLYLFLSFPTVAECFCNAIYTNGCKSHRKKQTQTSQDSKGLHMSWFKWTTMACGLKMHQHKAVVMKVSWFLLLSLCRLSWKSLHWATSKASYRVATKVGLQIKYWLCLIYFWLPPILYCTCLQLHTFLKNITAVSFIILYLAH